MHRYRNKNISQLHLSHPKVSMTALPEITEIKKPKWSDAIEITSEEDVVKIMKDNGSTPRL